MSHHPAGTPEPARLRAALATLVADEPALPSTVDDVERRGRRLARRRLTGLAAVFLIAGAGVTVGVVGLTGPGTDSGTPTAAGVPGEPAAEAPGGNPAAGGPAGAADGPAGVSDGPAGVPGGPAGVPGGPAGTGLAVGFPVGSAVDAVLTALPAAVTLGDLPMDIHWREGGRLDLPVTGGAGEATLALEVTDGGCAATLEPAGLLSAAELETVAGAVCDAWRAAGSPAIVPGGPVGEEQPEYANR